LAASITSSFHQERQPESYEFGSSFFRKQKEKMGQSNETTSFIRLENDKNQKQEYAPGSIKRRKYGSSKTAADSYNKNNNNPNNNNNNSITTSAAEFNQWLQKIVQEKNPSQLQMAEEALFQRIRDAQEESMDHHQVSIWQLSTSATTSSKTSDTRRRQRNKKYKTTTTYDTISFNIILNGWARQRSVLAAKRADALLHHLLQLQQSKPHIGHLVADSYSYSAVLKAYAKSGGGKEAALRAEELLTQMLQQSSTAVIKDDFCHNAVIDAWSVSGDVYAGERAEVWLRKLNEPTLISYNACIKAYARSQAPNEATRLLDEMKALSMSSNPELEPDKISISTCIDAWSKYTKNLTHAAFQAEVLLQEMEQDFEAWNKTQAAQTEYRLGRSNSKSDRYSSPSKQPDIVTYTAVLTAYARSGLPDAQEKAMQLLRRCEQYSDQKPNAHFFNTFISLLANSPSTATRRGTTTPASTNNTPEQVAESILQHMKEQYQASGNYDIRPTVVTYTALIAVYASHSHSQGHVAAAERAEKLLNELEDLYNQTSQLEYLPNTKTFGAVLSVWAKAASAAMNHDECSGAAWGDWLWQRAEGLLDRMERLFYKTGCEDLKPTTILYSQIFRILANGRDPNAATRGLKLMKKMKEMTQDRGAKNGYNEHILLDATMYAYLIVTFTKSKVENLQEVASQVLREVEEGYKAGMGNLKPTSLLYSAVLQAYAKSASSEGAMLAEELLEKTKTLYKQGKLYAKPTTLFYNAVIDAHARSNRGRDAAERAECLLDELETRGRAGDSELCLTTRSFNAAILAWKNSNATDAPERAEALLKRMNEKYKAGDERCRPDRVTINSIIGVWAKSSQEGAAVRAEEFLQFMERNVKSGDPIKPDIYSYNSVVDAYSKSPADDSARRAQAVYDRMKALHEAGERDLRPDLITLTSLRKAWIESEDEEKEKFLRRTGELIFAELAWRKRINSASPSFSTFQKQ